MEIQIIIGIIILIIFIGVSIYFIILQNNKSLKNTVSQNTVSQNTVSQNTVSQNTVSQNIASQYYTSQNITLYDLPVTNGAYARYQGKDYIVKTNTWYDSTGNGHNIPSSQITSKDLKHVSVNNINGSNKNITVLEGSTSSSIRFTKIEIPKYTLFHVLRYTGKNNGRILQSNGGDWLSGFNNEDCYVACHGKGKCLPEIKKSYTTDWILSTDYAYNYRADGKSNTNTKQNKEGITYLPPLDINYSSSKDKSSFQLADIIIYNRELSINEIEQVEEYLAKLYGLKAYLIPETPNINIKLKSPL